MELSATVLARVTGSRQFHRNCPQVKELRTADDDRDQPDGKDGPHHSLLHAGQGNACGDNGVGEGEGYLWHNQQGKSQSGVRKRRKARVRECQTQSQLRKAVKNA